MAPNADTRTDADPDAHLDTAAAACERPATQPVARSVAQWVQRLAQPPLPVLACSAEALEAARAREAEDGSVDVRALAGWIAEDPLMTLKLLAHVSASGSRRTTEVETVREALVLIGVAPFFRAFGAQPCAQQRLSACPQAQAGFDAVLTRAQRAARFALAFAVHRGDHDALVIRQAALLHDFAELLLWVHEPSLALAIAAQQRAQPSARSEAVQTHWLGAALVDVQHAMMQRWCLPELLVRITDDRHADAPAVRSVVLAVRLARHTAVQFSNPALPDDVRDIAALLNLRIDPTLALLSQLQREDDDSLGQGAGALT